MNSNPMAFQDLAEKLKDIKFCMLTTTKEDGTLQSRPMVPQKLEPKNFQGDFWFFTKRETVKVESIKKDQHVNLAFADPDHQVYISISGIAEPVEDKKKMKEFWNPVLKAWFPEGLNDPEICLIRVRSQTADIWDSPSSKVVQAAGLAKATLTGKSYEGDDHFKHLDMSRPH
jgi:general stress protein 26